MQPLLFIGISDFNQILVIASTVRFTAIIWCVILIFKNAKKVMQDITTGRQAAGIKIRFRIANQPNFMRPSFLFFTQSNKIVQ